MSPTSKLAAESQVVSAKNFQPIILPVHATERVLHVINGEHYSGAERVQDLLAEQLPKLGYHVGFACLKPGKFLAARHSMEAPLYQLKMYGRSDMGVVRRLATIIRDEQYALVHAHTPRAALIARLAANRTGVPFVYHVHSPAGNDSTRYWQNWLNGKVESWSLKRAAYIICVSPSLQAYMLEKGFDANQIICVPNGVPIAVKTPDRKTPTTKWTLGMVALFRPRKGLEVLLQALAKLHSEGLPVRLRAIGPFETPRYEAEIMQRVAQLGISETIDWVGFTQNVPQELAQIDAMVLPSLFGEGLPMVVLEAMSAGVPVIATRVQGVPEAIIHRKTGLLAEAGSVSQLAQAIEELVCGDTNYLALSRQAKAHHAKNFSDEAMARGVAKVYDTVL